MRTSEMVLDSLLMKAGIKNEKDLAAASPDRLAGLINVNASKLAKALVEQAKVNVKRPEPAVEIGKHVWTGYVSSEMTMDEILKKNN